MRAVVTRVKEASVTIAGAVRAQIGRGFLVLLGVAPEDTEKEAAYLADRITGVRIFADDLGKMNLNLAAVSGALLVVSQFTLMASCKKGNRPSWIHAAPHEISIPLYHRFCDVLTSALGKKIGTGEFGAYMKVDLLNDGPVTICMDSHNKE